MNDKFKVIVVGCGNWGLNHIKFLKKMNCLHGVADLDEKLSQKISNIYKCNSFSLKEVFLKKRSDALFICSSAASHFSLLKKAMPIYKNIFCEKPVTLNLKHFKEIIKLKNKYKNRFAVGHLLHYHPAIPLIEGIIKKKRLGKIVSIYCVRKSFGKFRKEEDIIQSLIPHDLSIIFRFFKKKIVKIGSHASSVLNKNIFDTANCFLEFLDKSFAYINVSWFSPKKKRIIQIDTNKAIITFDDTLELQKKVHIQYIRKINKNNFFIFQKKKNFYIPIKIKTPALSIEILEVINYFKGKIKKIFNNLEESEKIIDTISKLRKTL